MNEIRPASSMPSPAPVLNAVRVGGRRAFVIGAAACIAAGCAPPFHIHRCRAPDGRSRRRDAPLQLVFLTGATDTIDTVREHGAIEILSGVVGHLDAVIVDRQAPSFMAGEYVAELHRRVTTSRGHERYRRRVLLGFSSGATAALEYLTFHPRAYDAVILYAPFLGPEIFIEEIRAAGGLAAWTPSPPIERQELRWAWLKDYANDPAGKPDVHVLWGDRDEVAPGLGLLEEVLPREHVHVGHGEHGWPAFDDVWWRFVDQNRGVFTAGRRSTSR